MELLSFYFLNILVGSILSVVLGLYGSHVVSRNKTVETIFLGQSIQVGILIGVIVGNYLAFDHNDHGVHLEVIISIIFTCFIYGLYELVTKSRKFAKTPILVTLYIILISLSYLIVAASPIIESHMVKSFLGDIITASKIELLVILFLSILFLIYFKLKNNLFLLQSFDISSFGYLINSKNKTTYFIFNLFILTMMIYSIHVMGIVFTIMTMIFPISLMQFTRFSLNELYGFILLCAPSSVILGFLMNTKFESLPTSSLMVICYIILGSIYLIIKRLSSSK